MNSSWKTTVGGILAAAGTFLVNSQTGVLNLVGQIVQAVGLFLLGFSAQDVKKAQSMAKQMIKRKDGSVSQRGLWDNIRANKGSGKKPTKQMLQQEKKIKSKSK